MRINISDEAVSIVLASLEKQHRELVRKADSWSYDLEGDFDEYIQHRQQELELAHAINSIKKQRTFQQAHPNLEEAPLADWEKALLAGEPVQS